MPGINTHAGINLNSTIRRGAQPIPSTAAAGQPGDSAGAPENDPASTAQRHHAPRTHPVGRRASSNQSQNSHTTYGRPVRQHCHRHCVRPDNPVRARIVQRQQELPSSCGATLCVDRDRREALAIGTPTSRSDTSPAARTCPNIDRQEDAEPQKTNRCHGRAGCRRGRGLDRRSHPSARNLLLLSNPGTPATRLHSPGLFSDPEGRNSPSRVHRRRAHHHDWQVCAPPRIRGLPLAYGNCGERELRSIWALAGAPSTDRTLRDRTAQVPRTQSALYRRLCRYRACRSMPAIARGQHAKSRDRSNTHADSQMQS